MKFHPIDNLSPYRDTFKKVIASILKWESRLVLWKYKPKVISITGSVGKTSSKDAIYSVLAEFAYVRKSEKSYNSEIGLPLTILGIPNGWNNPTLWLRNILKGLWLFIYPHKYPEWLVLEVGVGKPGDMKKTALWLKSDIVVFTTIGDTPAHIEFFSSTKHVIEEKSKLIQTLKKDGLLVLNFDDKTVLELKHKTKNRILTYGFEEGADIRGEEAKIFYDDLGLPRGLSFRVSDKGSSLPVFVEGVFGKNHLYASLVALTVISSLKFNMLQAIDALKNYEVPAGRMRLLEGINDSYIIDDTYNSSPFACESALLTLSDMRIGLRGRGKRPGRKIAVLGDMLELGKHTVEAHKKIGTCAREVADFLVVVGPRAQHIREGALESGMPIENIIDFSNSIHAGEFLRNFVKKNDAILVKGSQGMRMERAVSAILKDTENKHKLLVRQDEEWLAKN